MIWSFAGFELDDDHYELRRHGQPIELRRKVFDVLRYLVTRCDRVVSKEELLQEVWPGETIHEAVVAQNIAILRKVLDDSREAARIIQTVHGRGYRFVAEVSAQRADAVPTLAGARPLPASPFLGREHAMEELRRLLRGALAGNGRFAVLTGEAGIGKTRTAEELAAEARALGVRVLEGRCHEGEGSPAYWPWIQILRAALGDGDRARLLGGLGDGAADVALLAGDTRGQSAAGPRRPPLDSAEARFALFDAITSLFARLAREQPLLLVFDDLHWADEATLHLLRFVARELRPLPLLVLGTCRDPHVDAEAVTSSLLSSLIGGTHAHRIHLSGLSPTATRALVVATLQRELDEPRLRELQALTEGNPFFVHEVLRLLADDGDEGEGGARWRRELPQRVREVIGLRLSALGAEARRVLSLAAVIGRDFSVAVLEPIAGVPRTQLLALLEAAAKARILTDAGESGALPSGRYRFAHALIRESLYGALSEPERVRVHEQVGLALEALFGVDAGEHTSELASHFYRAASGGDIERAVAYCVRSAEQALGLLAFEQAAFEYRRALEALACRLPIDEQRRFALKLALGSALFRAGEDGNPALLGAAAIARQLGRPDLLGRVVLSMCGWPRVGRRGRTANHDLYPLLSEALAAPLSDEPVLRARLLAALALNAPPETSLAEQARLCDQSLELARSAGDDEALHDALLSSVQLMPAPEDTARRLALASELLTVAQRLGHDERTFTAHGLRIQPLIALGDLAAADREIASCTRLAERLRLRRCTLQVLRLRLERALGDGRFDEIRALTSQAVDARGKAPPSPGYMINLFLWRTFERALRGDRGWFERNIDAMAADVDKSTLLRSNVAYFYALFGQPEQARACYAPLLRPELLDRHDEDWLMTLALAAEAVAACRDRAAAAELYPRLLPHGALNVVHLEWFVYLGATAHALGVLAELLGEQAAAVDHFELALEINARLGAKPALARTSFAYGRMLLAGRSANADVPRAASRAHALLRDAAGLAQETGMQGLLADVQKLLD